jgi:uncharacterized protein
MHWLLMYSTAPDYLERRAAFREEHLSLAWAAHDRGELLLGGAWGDPVEGAMLLFTGEDAGAAERFAASDPYVVHGLVIDWRVVPWNTVAGSGAANPTRPSNAQGGAGR